jgi:antitoxin component YwqK of YwqJK toxin-antitoxin module
MINKLIIILLLFSNFIFGQKKDSIIEANYYKSGKPKLITYYRGVDTFEVRRYYKNGQLGDSLWLVVSEKKETAIGIEKSYFENGKLSEITYHGKQEDHYVTNSYRKNGTIYSHIVKPTGVSKYYNSKGEVIKQFDENTKVAVNVAEEPSEIIEIIETTAGQCTGRGDGLVMTADLAPDEKVILIQGNQY